MPPIAPTRHIWASTDALAGCVDLASDMNFDARPYLARHGIDSDLIENARGLLPFQAISDCLEDIAISEARPDFGFQLGQRQKPLQFGIISQVLQFAPTVGDAIRIFLRYRDLYSQASHWDLHIEDDIARLIRRELGAPKRISPQIPLLSVTRGFEAIRSLMGGKWAPIAVYFSTDEVPFAASMRRHFKAPVFFNSQHDEIAFEAIDLEQIIPTGNAEILTALTSHFDRIFPEVSNRGPVSAQVQKQIRIALADGQFSLPDIARHFGLHPRSLQRALLAEGSSFQGLVAETRMAISRQIVETSRVPLSDVASLAGYRHLSSFSRAYKRSQGKPPRQTR
jgi:AraC-like DNA-binding protein